jgi:hypothetical protein
MVYLYSSLRKKYDVTKFQITTCLITALMVNSIFQIPMLTMIWLYWTKIALLLQPSTFCLWDYDPSDRSLVWQQDDEYDCYCVEWIQYIVNRILKPRGFALDGFLIWKEEGIAGRGKIAISDNEITINFPTGSNCPYSKLQQMEEEIVPYHYKPCRRSHKQFKAQHILKKYQIRC